jgi:hypothetical protein
VVSQHLLGDWCDRCGLLVPASEIQGGLCGDCRDGDDRALARMDYLFGRDWFEAK